MHVILTEVFRVYPQLLQANAGIILSNSAFINHPIIRRHIVSILTVSLHNQNKKEFLDVQRQALQ
jgi:hypothetical protein